MNRDDGSDDTETLAEAALIWFGALLTYLACQLLTLGRWIWPGRKP